MSSAIEKHLAEQNIQLPPANPPAGNYVPTATIGDMVYVSGQTPRFMGKVEFVGKLGKEFGVENGQKAARLCGLNILAQLKQACGGDLDRVVRCVKLTGFVNCTPDFPDQPAVINGASDLMVAVFGDRGRHVRSAVGSSSLPSNVACEIEAIFQIRQ